MEIIRPHSLDEPHTPNGDIDENLIETEDIPRRSKRLLEETDYDVIGQDLDKLPAGLHEFTGHGEVFWTDAGFDAATSIGKEQIASRLGVKLEQIISFSAAKHTNEVLIVDSQDGLHRVSSAVNPSTNEVFEAGWSEPIVSVDNDQSLGSERGTYDGIILIGKDNFKDNYLLTTGADCTPVGVRGVLRSGESFIAVVHGGRKGTMTGVMDNLAKRLQWLGAITDSIEIFVGPAAQAIEVPLDVLEKEGGDDNSWRRGSISNAYTSEQSTRVLYNNQLDSVRRLAEHLGVGGKSVHVINIDTVSDEASGILHSFRRDKTAERNSLIIGFEKN